MTSQQIQKKQGCFESMWKGIIRPPRFTYSINDMGKDVWVMDNCVVRRYDFELKNKRGLDLVGRFTYFFEPMRVFDKPHQSVIYLHGNSSSRIEALGILEYLIPYDISVCSFDFSGCGQSEGKYISLGYHEKEDVKAVYEWLKQNKPMVTSVALWGRSMGSVTAILSCQIIPQIKVLVCDSPFSSLRLLCRNLARQSYKVPGCLFCMIFCCIKRKIMNEAQFDVDRLNIAEEIKSLPKTVNIIFLSAKQDVLIDSSYPTQLYNNFPGYKKILYFEGNHNSRRPKDIQNLVTKFLIERMDRQEGLGQTSNRTSQRVPQKVQLQQIKPKELTPNNEECDPIINQHLNQHTFVENIQTPAQKQQ